MANFNGAKCISCGEVFKANDDVVVCPECGTPYHRVCYENEGQCINTALHESGESWKPEYDSDSFDSTEAVKCIRCGTENPPEGLFCNKCGMPLHDKSNNASRPFNNAGAGGFFGMNQDGQGQNGFPFGTQMILDKDSEIDGIKIDDYVKYTGKNSTIFISNFVKFSKFGSKVALNIGALVFPELYFFYRKMYKLGVLFMAAFMVLSFVIISQSSSESDNLMSMLAASSYLNNQDGNSSLLYICSYLQMGVRFLSGFFATYWYYLKAKSDIRKIRSTESDDYEAGLKITEKGGTSFPAVIVAFTVNAVLTLVGLFLLARFL